MEGLPPAPVQLEEWSRAPGDLAGQGFQRYFEKSVRRHFMLMPFNAVYRGTLYIIIMLVQAKSPSNRMLPPISSRAHRIFAAALFSQRNQRPEVAVAERPSAISMRRLPMKRARARGAPDAFGA